MGLFNTFCKPKETVPGARHHRKDFYVSAVLHELLVHGPVDCIGVNSKYLCPIHSHKLFHGPVDRIGVNSKYLHVPFIRKLIHGPVDQLEDRYLGMVEARGSNPRWSILFLPHI